MNALVLHVLNNPTMGCSVIELKGEVITSAYLDQGTESDFEVACERAIMSSPGQCRERTIQAEEAEYKEEAYGSTQVTLYSQTTLNGWYREM